MGKTGGEPGALAEKATPDKGETDLRVSVAPNLSSSLSRGSLIAVASTALSACGGGGGTESGGDGAVKSGSKSASAMTASISDTQAARFLLQAQFSVTETDIDNVKSQGFEAWLATQLDTPPSQSGTAWLDSRHMNIPVSADPVFNPTYGDNMIWRMLMTGTDQVRKRAALALSEIMVASLNGINTDWSDYMMAGYWDMLNVNAFGNFRTLLEEVTLNPAIGLYLNTNGNLKEDAATGRRPDENYAREVMQLFTIGLYELNQDGTIRPGADGKPVETYTQDDISNLARVFTGYEVDHSRGHLQTVPWSTYQINTTEFTRDRMKLDPNKHSSLSATFLGTTIPANTEGKAALKTALDTLFNHPNVGPFFSRQLIQRFVTSNPSPAYIGRVAAVFNNNGAGVRGDLKAVFKAILTDAEALGMPTEAGAGKLREPMIRFVQWARTFNVTSATGKWEINDLSTADTALGQSPLRSPSVFNYFRPGYVPPQTAMASAGLVAPEFQIHNETSTAGYINFMGGVIASGHNDVRPDYSQIMAMAHDTQKLLAWLNLHMSANQLSANTLSIIGAALETVSITQTSPDNIKSDRVQAAILLVMACPEYIVQK